MMQRSLRNTRISNTGIAAATLCVLLGTLLSLAEVARADAIDIANHLRRDGCARMTPLHEALLRDARLDRAAGRIARGAELRDATAAEGFAARRVARVRAENAEGPDLERILESEFCGIVASPEFSHIGQYRAGNETWLVFAAPLALDTGDNDASAANRLFAAVNQARARARRCGAGPELAAAPPLTRSAQLDAAAREHVADIASRGELGHTGSDGSTAAERVERTGYDWRTVGENVASGQSRAEETADTWVASDGHCRNLMDPRFLQTGVAVAVNPRDPRAIYWVQVYAAPR